MSWRATPGTIRSRLVCVAMVSAPLAEGSICRRESSARCSAPRLASRLGPWCQQRRTGRRCRVAVTSSGPSPARARHQLGPVTSSGGRPRAMGPALPTRRVDPLAPVAFCARPGCRRRCATEGTHLLCARCRSNRRETRRDLLAAGICARCCQRVRCDGRTACAACLEREKLRSRADRAARRGVQP